MKAPDKIYLHGYPLYDELCAEWAEVPFHGQFRGQQAETVEYIRKDALMEKLKKVAAEYKKRSDEGELVWQNMCGINEAIDILNKM